MPFYDIIWDLVQKDRETGLFVFYTIPASVAIFMAKKLYLA